MIPFERLAAIQRHGLDDLRELGTNRIDQGIERHRIIGPAPGIGALTRRVTAGKAQRDDRAGEDDDRLYQGLGGKMQVANGDAGPQAAQHVAAPDGRDHEQQIGVDQAGDAKQGHVAAGLGIEQVGDALHKDARLAGACRRQAWRARFNIDE